MPSKVRRSAAGTGSVFQRSRDGKWVARAELGWRNGKRDQKLFVADTMAEAIAKRTAFLALRRDGFTPPKGRPAYVSEWCLHWLHNIAKPRVEETTWDRSYRSKVESLIIPFFERIPLPELTEEDIEAWHRQLERQTSERTGKPLSASTIGQAHRILSTALKAAVVRGKMPRNPCSNVTPPRVRTAEPEPPTADQVAAILERCASWPNGARWVVAITTGLRQGEALALEWRDVRLSAPASLTVRRSAGRVAKGKLVVKAPKSDKSRRTIPLTSTATAALREHRKAQQEARLAAPEWEDHGLVFCRHEPGRRRALLAGRPWHPRDDWQDWQDLLADLGMPAYRVHDLRHGTATMLLEAGVDVRVVQELMGHATPAFTQKAYQHVRPTLKQAAVDILEQALRGDGS